MRIHIGDDVMLGFTYEDSMAGPSAKGALLHEGSLDDDVRRAIERPNQTVRLHGDRFRRVPLGPDEIARLGLPAQPAWMSLFPQPSRPWRDDPALAGRFHPDYPDDLEVRFYFPAHRRAETMWVRTRGLDAEIGGFTGQLLNQPHTAGSGVEQGATVSYRAARGAPNPIWVSPALRASLREWSTECSSCGFDMLIEPIDVILGPRFVAGLGDRSHKILGGRCPMCEHEITIERRRGR